MTMARVLLATTVVVSILGSAAAAAAETSPPPRLESAPELVAGADPIYPEAARAAGRTGDVALRVVIDGDGVVSRVDVVGVPVDDAGVVDDIGVAMGWAALGAATNFVFTGASFCTSSPAKDGGVTETCGQHLPVAVDYRMTFALSPVGGAAGTADGIDEVNFSGVVRDAVHHAPLGGVSVTVLVGDVGLDPGTELDHAEHGIEGTDSHGPADTATMAELRGGVIEAVTDDNGRFAVRGVPDGDHRVLFVVSGFERAEIVEHFSAHERTEVVVELSEHVVRETVIHRHRGLREVGHVALTGMQATTTLTAEALQAVRGRSLAGTLTEVPGVTMVQAGPQVAKPVVRGQFGRRLMTLVDGVRHEGQDWGIDHAPEIDPFSAGSISVVRGAAGVRYGPDAVAGVVLIEPRPLRNTPGVDGSVDVIGIDNGLMGMVAGRVDAVPAWLPGLTVRLEGDGSKGAAVSTPTYVLGNTASQNWSLGAAAGYTSRWAGGGVTARASFRHLQQDSGVCFCLKVNTPDDLTALVSADKPVGADGWTTTWDIDRPRQAVAHDTAIARGAVELGGLGTATVTYAFQLDRRDEFDQVRQSITRPQYSFNLITHAVDVVVEHTPLRAGRFTLGGTAGAHGDLQEHAYVGLPLIPNFRRLTGGVFAIERLDIAPSGVGDVTLELGARYDLMGQTAFLADSAFDRQVRRGKLDSTACVTGAAGARCDTDADAFTVTGGARTAIDLGALDDALTLSVEGSSATRFPDVDELYLTGRAPSFPVFGLGDAALGPETTLSSSIGARLALPQLLVVDVSFFASQTSDYIAFGPELGPNGAPVIDVLITGAYPRFSYTAVDALFSGVDGSVIVAPDSPVSLVGQLAVVQGRNLSTGGALPFVPPVQGRVEAQWHVPDVAGTTDGVVTGGMRTVFRQNRTDAGSDFTPPPPGYVLLDAAARTTVLDGKVQVGLEVKNLLNQRYRDSMSLLRFFADQPGREIWLRLSVSLDSDELPR